MFTVYYLQELSSDKASPESHKRIAVVVSISKQVQGAPRLRKPITKLASNELPR